MALRRIGASAGSRGRRRARWTRPRQLLDVVYDPSRVGIATRRCNAVHRTWPRLRSAERGDCVLEQTLHLAALAVLADFGGDDLGATLRPGWATIEPPLDQAVHHDVDTGCPVRHGGRVEPGDRHICR